MVKLKVRKALQPTNSLTISVFQIYSFLGQHLAYSFNSVCMGSLFVGVAFGKKLECLGKEISGCSQALYLKWTIAKETNQC
ncbi:hypothetical protein AVEN_171941-1, partial [Araneus ventricosus]